MSYKDSQNLAASNLIAYMQNMLDLVERKATDLEAVGDNLHKISLRNMANILIGIRNTARSSVANDMFIDCLVAVIRETYAEFPHAPTIKDSILDAIELFMIASGKHYQGETKLFDESLLEALKGVSLQKKPVNLLYDQYKREKKPKVIEYKH
jgi:hypothetical protein